MGDQSKEEVRAAPTFFIKESETGAAVQGYRVSRNACICRGRSFDRDLVLRECTRVSAVVWLSKREFGFSARDIVV